MAARHRDEHERTVSAAEFNLEFEPRHALRELRRDPLLAKLIKRCGPFTLEPKACASPFAALAESITFQQLNGKAAASIFARLKTLGPLTPKRILAAQDEALRGAGLSRAKVIALKDLAVKAEEGLVPGWSALRRLDDETILERLTQVRGIGRWTVEMLLIFRLGRRDIWPVDDFAVRKAFGLLVGDPNPSAKAMRERAEAWRPWRSVVAWYLWRSLD